MATQKKVIVKIGKDGHINYECEGYVGDECKSVSEMMSNLGQVAPLDDKCESFQIPIPDPVQTEVSQGE